MGSALAGDEVRMRRVSAVSRSERGEGCRGVMPRVVHGSRATAQCLAATTTTPNDASMAQPEGNSLATTGRIGAQIGTPAIASSFALGAGWGTTASVVVAAGSNDQAGIITVTSSGTGQAQATANVTFTFSDGTYAGIPRAAIVTLMSSSNAVTEAQPTNGAVSATVLSWRHSVLPVAAATYKYSYLVVA